MTASDHLKQVTGSLGGDQIPEDLMTDEQLDAELRSYGISESDIDKQLARIKKAIKEKTPTISEQLTHSKEDWKERAFAAEAALAQKTRECEELHKHLLQTNKNLQAELENVIALKAQVEQLGRQVAEMDGKLHALVADREPNGYPLWFNREVRECPGCDSEDLCMGHHRMAERNFVRCETNVEKFIDVLASRARTK